MDTLGPGFDTLLTRGALALLVLAAAWSLAVVVAVALEVRTRGRVRIARHTGCPPALRLWLIGVFTAALAGVAPAQASDHGSGPAPGTAPTRTLADTRPGARDAVAVDLDGLALPDRTVDRRAQHRDAPNHPSSHPSSHPSIHPGGHLAATEVVVARGDSLWRIARQRLPRRADDTAIAAAVAALHAVNRAVIGPDPDRIAPGQHLVFPALPIHPEEP